jgi:hypothetical protein
MRKVVAIASVVVCGTIIALAQPSPQGLPIVHLRACRVETTPASANADAQGRLATYQLTVNQNGEPSKLARTSDPANLVRFVKIEQFESCVNEWRFGAPGDYTLTLFGGTVGLWRIDIAQGNRTARIDLR